LETLRFQADFQLATAAVNAATRLAAQSAQSPDNLAPPESTQSKIENQQSKIPLVSILRLAHARQRFAAIESRHTAVQTLTAELEQSQAEVADLRTQLATAQQKLRLSVPLDPYIMQRPLISESETQPPEVPPVSPPAESTQPADDPTRDALDDLDDLDAAANADDPADLDAADAEASTREESSHFSSESNGAGANETVSGVEVGSGMDPLSVSEGIGSFCQAKAMRASAILPRMPVPPISGCMPSPR
ncbi:MAG: hypothetical protein ACHRHE_20415, partial [Tepidisphaerales bacterium]